MIERMIRAKVDLSLKTNFGSHYLVEGEVKKVKFKNERIFAGFLQGGTIEEAKDAEETKVIPVISLEVKPEAPAPVEEVPAVEEIPIEEVPAVEIPLDEAGEIEGKETDEDRRSSESPIEEAQVAEEIPIAEQDLTKPGRPSFFATQENKPEEPEVIYE